MTAVPVRIPRAANTVWDAAEQRPLKTTFAALSVASLVLFAWFPSWPIAALVFFAGIGITSAVYTVLLAQVSEERDNALREAADARARYQHVAAGDASAVTTELRHIGDTGGTP